MLKSLDGLTGEEIADIAYAQNPIPPSGLGVICEALIYFFGVICTIVMGLRVYVRMFKVENDVQWRLNDYLAVVGFLPYIPAAVLGALSVHYGVGATDTYLDTFEMRNFITVRGMEYLILYELIYYASSTITKFAIAVTILYICVERRYKYIMYGIMCIMAITAAICVANVASDWACAITPFFIVYSLQMTRQSKIAVVGILGLGVLASIAALMRIISYQYIDIRKYPNDHMVSQGRLLLWSVLESSLAIIACSLPALKVFGNCLAKSMNRSKGTTRPKLAYNDATPMHSLGPGGHVRTTVSVKGNWDRLHDDDSIIDKGLPEHQASPSIKFLIIGG
ncbi:integral membrane [Fusarium sporotrichioides]|uniref:Integral membrane n=1 Tax=Fusarium sporotrichioides TaxID=5514 RepID=A0A395SH30_FUSSP|nr:integral membrane [Fusarium sporotrichioides]